MISSFQLPESRIICEQRNTKALLDGTDLGVGVIYVSERTLSWREPGGVGFTLNYPSISMHAKATDPNVYPQECIYVMLDGKVSLPGQAEEPPKEENSDSETSEADISELIFVPEDREMLNAIYAAISECQALNPDPEDMDDEDNLFEDAEEEFVGAQEGVDDIGAGGDHGVNSLTRRLEQQSIQINYSNGHQDADEEHFEDAD